MIRLYENELVAVYLDLIKKYFGKPYCTSQEIVDFKSILMDLSIKANTPMVAFGDQSGNAWFYSDGVNVSVQPKVKDTVDQSLIRSYDKLVPLDENGVLYQAFLQTVKRAIDREEEELHAKKLKYLQLSYEKQSQLKK